MLLSARHFWSFAVKQVYSQATEADVDSYIIIYVSGSSQINFKGEINFLYKTKYSLQLQS